MSTGLGARRYHAEARRARREAERLHEQLRALISEMPGYRFALTQSEASGNYRVAYRREPEPSGLLAWLDSSATIEQIEGLISGRETAKGGA